MKDINILDNFVDEREFRNYIYSLLREHGFSSVIFDDVRSSDDEKINNNDMLAKKNDVIYTVQTFLNVPIGEQEIDETLKDMENEHVSFALIVTNVKVYDEIKEYAKNKGIEIWDRDMLLKFIK